MTRKLLIPTLLLATGCPMAVDNPTGECVPDDDGSRACYHAPDRGDTYLPDCDAPLDRELWRVFALDEEVAYVMPRPDATGLTYGICDGEDADLAELFERSGLCEEIADPDLVNALPIADALAVTHALHERLDFEAVDYGDGTWGIAPVALEVDLADACAGPAAGVTELEDACDILAGRIDGDECTDIGVVFDETTATLLADALDDLYGISG